jgi:signal transduction histidine kinase
MNLPFRFLSVSRFSQQNSRPNALQVWVLAAVLPICSLLLSMAFWRFVYPAIFILFFAAVSVAALKGGFVPGMVAALESAVVGNYFLLRPKATLIRDYDSLLRTALFLLSCALISYVGEKQLRSNSLLRRVHSELVEEHERVELALSAGKAFAWYHDPRTHKVTCKGNLEVVNELGFPISTEEWLNAVHPDDQAEVREALAVALQTGKPYEIEYRINTREKTYWLHTWAKGIVGNDGKVIRVVGVTVDKTQEKRMQAVLAKSEQFAVAGRLAATVAHEIRNPLETIGNVAFLLRSSGRLTTEDVQMLDTVSDEVDHIARIAKNTLTLHRSSQNVTVFKVCEAVDLVLEFYNKKFALKKIELRNSRSTLDTKMTGNLGELRQVVSNLVGNAVDAVENHGVIAVRVRRIGKGIAARVRITVADNGHGITESTRPGLFKPFFTTKEESGTGLGLWVTKQMVESAGGSIRMRSSTKGPRRGTTFSIVLPTVTCAGESLLSSSVRAS